jgi:hypothetical protein
MFDISITVATIFNQISFISVNEMTILLMYIYQWIEVISINTEAFLILSTGLATSVTTFPVGYFNLSFHNLISASFFFS